MKKVALGVVLLFLGCVPLGCVAEQIEKHTRSITEMEKTLEDQSTVLQEIQDATGKTETAIGEIRTRTDGIDASLDEVQAGLEERIRDQQKMQEEHLASLGEWETEMEDKISGIRTDLNDVAQKALQPEEGPSSEQLELKIDGVAGKLPGLESRLGTAESDAKLAAQAMAAADKVREEYTGGMKALRHEMTAALQERDEPTLVGGLPVKTGGALGVLAFFIVLLVLILHFATRSAVTKRVDSLQREMEDLAAAQRVQSRMAQQAVKPPMEDEGAMRESIEAFKVTLEEDDKKVRHLYSIGSSFMDVGTFRVAKEWFDAVLKIKPDYTDALIERATCQAMMGNYKEADISLEKALKQNKDHPRAWYNKACVSAKLGNDGEMFTAISEAIQRDPGAKDRFKEDPDFRKYWAHPEFTRRTS